MDILQSLGQGFLVVFEPLNIFMALLGCVIGLLVGVLPGLGPSAAIAILLPVTYGLNPATSIIMLTAIYYGAMFGGGITSILINTPGENSAVMTAVEGYPLALQGKGALALRISLLACFIGGTVSVIGLTVLAQPIAVFALKFGPPEYFALMCMGLAAVVFVGGSTVPKCLASGLFGLLLGAIGTEPISGSDRLTFGLLSLADGIPFIVAAMGLFAAGEVLVNVEENFKLDEVKQKISNIWPSKKDLKHCSGGFTVGTVTGFILGSLPGAGPTISAFLGYAIEKARMRGKGNWGKGEIAGIAAVESAANAATGGSMLPLLTLGVPGSGATAVLLGAFIMYGLRPGPLLFTQAPDVAWGTIASMYFGNLLIVLLSMPLVPLFTAMLKIPYSILYPGILVVCVIGAYSLTNTIFPVILFFIFSVIGYIMKKLDIPAAPAVLALILGPMVESSLSQSLTMSHGSPLIFFTRPVSLVLMLIIFGFMFAPLIKKVVARSRRAPA